MATSPDSTTTPKARAARPHPDLPCHLFEDPDFRPDCTVRYDAMAGCGVNVERSGSGDGMFVSLDFVSCMGVVDGHSLTRAQVEQLRAALDAVMRTDPLVKNLRHAAGEEVLRVTAAAPAILANDGRRRPAQLDDQPPEDAAT